MVYRPVDFLAVGIFATIHDSFNLCLSYQRGILEKQRRWVVLFIIETCLLRVETSLGCKNIQIDVLAVFGEVATYW